MNMFSLFKRTDTTTSTVLTRFRPKRAKFGGSVGDDHVHRHRDPTRRLCCRTVHYSAKLHAAQLLIFLARHESVEFAMASGDLQDSHGAMCLEAGWWVRPWNPVGRQVALLTTAGKKVYEWQTERGVRKRVRVFPIPSTACIHALCDPILGRYSLAIPKASREYPWPGPPAAQHCPHTGHACPIWRAACA